MKSDNVFDIYSLTNGTIANGRKENDDKLLPPSPTILVSNADHLEDRKKDNILQKSPFTIVTEQNNAQQIDFSSDSSCDTVADTNAGLFMNFDRNRVENQPNDVVENCDGHESAECLGLSAGGDAMSLLTGGLLHGSNLIHLEAGEPICVRKWSDSQFVDFFASSVAYGVVEAGKAVAQERGEETG